MSVLLPHNTMLFRSKILDWVGRSHLRGELCSCPLPTTSPLLYSYILLLAMHTLFTLLLVSLFLLPVAKLVTFDSFGVSGHVNHIQTHKSVEELIRMDRHAVPSELGSIHWTYDHSVCMCTWVYITYIAYTGPVEKKRSKSCLLYTSDAADE